MPLADHALTGISRGVRLLLGKDPSGRQSDPNYDAAKVANEQSKTQGQDIENQVASYVSNLMQNPSEIARAAAAAAGINTTDAEDYYKYRDSEPIQSPVETDGMVHLRPSSLSNLSDEAEQALNQFRVARYGGLVNPKGSKDFAQGIDQGMQTEIARQAANAAQNPNAAVSLSQGKPYMPYRISDNTVIDEGTGDLGPTTEIGKQVMANIKNTMGNRDVITTERVNTEKHRQGNIDSKRGFAPGKGGTDGHKELANLPPERRYGEARKMAIRELDADIRNGEDPTTMDDVETRTQSILAEADNYAHPKPSQKGTPSYDAAVDYAVGKDPAQVKKALKTSGWGDKDIGDIVERSTNFLKLQAAAAVAKDPAAFKAKALKLGWSEKEVKMAMGK